MSSVNSENVVRRPIGDVVSPDLVGSDLDVTVAEYDDGSVWFEKTLEDMSAKEASGSILSGIVLSGNDYMAPEVRVRDGRLQSRSVGEKMYGLTSETLEQVDESSLDSLYEAAAGKVIMGDQDIRKNIQYNAEDDSFYALDFDDSRDDLLPTLNRAVNYVDDIASGVGGSEENVGKEILDRAAETAAYTDFSRLEEEMDQYNLDDSIVENVLSNLEQLQNYHMSDETAYEFMDPTPDHDDAELL